MPDLNSLPPSRSPSLRPGSGHPLPPPLLQPQTSNSPLLRSSPHLDRRRSSAFANWSLNDEPPSPQHHRAPSLGEMHQAMESEQEGQVNRLLGMIRAQQAQIQQLQLAHTQSHTSPDSTTSAAATTSPLLSAALPPRPISSLHSSSSTHLRRTDSSSPQYYRSESPSSGAFDSNAVRESHEAELLKQEAAMVQRENAMLRVRIRELERIVRERDGEV